MKFGSLFAGIGGIDLGLERAGMECIWQVENDEYCTRILEKHWPKVQRFRDVRKQHGQLSHIMEADGHFGGCETCLPPVDLIAGGFPCQPHSVAGKRRGAEDDRNLWPEFIRVVRELKPRYVFAENVPGIVTTYIDTVLSDLESEGYTCAPLNLPAVAFDAPHRRERIFIVAYANGTSGQSFQPEISRAYDQIQDARSSRTSVADTDRSEQGRECQSGRQAEKRIAVSGGGENVADANGIVRQTGRNHSTGKQSRHRKETQGNRSINDWWTTEPDVGRVAHGVPSRVDRLRGLGNAVVPQVAEWIGRRILNFDSE